MPKVSIYEDRNAIPNKDNIRLAGEAAS